MLRIYNKTNRIINITSMLSVNPGQYIDTDYNFYDNRLKVMEKNGLIFVSETPEKKPQENVKIESKVENNSDVSTTTKSSRKKKESE